MSAVAGKVGAVATAAALVVGMGAAPLRAAEITVTHYGTSMGLGRVAITAMENDNTPLLIALALPLFVVATLAGRLLLAFDRRLHRLG